MSNWKLTVKIGSRRWLCWDLLEEAARELKLGKSEIKRLFKQGAIIIYAPKGVKWSD